MIIGGLIIVTAAGLYVENVAQERQKMVQIKVLSTFFQTTELTTHISIQWPKVAFWCLPFRIPMTDASCLSPPGWDTRWNFLMMFYVPVLVFVVLYLRWRQFPIGSTGEKKVQQLGVFLGMLWYTPCLQAAASMYDCVQEDGEYFLRMDTHTPCQYKSYAGLHWFESLDYIDYHAIFVGVVIGIGLPAYIFRTLRRHRRKGKLDGSSPYTALFELYIPSHCAFECCQMVRKFCLIAASGTPWHRFLPDGWVIGGWTTFADNPYSLKLEQRIQAYTVLGVNVVFLVVFMVTRPMVKEPSRFFPKVNLFSAAEGMSICITITGNILALIGTFEKEWVFGVGVAFATINFLFAFSFLVAFFLELRAGQNGLREGNAARNAAFEKTDLSRVKLGKAVKGALVNWSLHLETLSRMTESAEQFYMIQMRNEARMILSRVKAAIRDELMEKNERIDELLANIKDVEADVGYKRLRLMNDGMSYEDAMKTSAMVKLMKRLDKMEKEFAKETTSTETQEWLDSLVVVFDKMSEDAEWESQWKSPGAGKNRGSAMEITAEDVRLAEEEAKGKMEEGGKANTTAAVGWGVGGGVVGAIGKLKTHVKNKTSMELLELMALKDSMAHVLKILKGETFDRRSLLKEIEMAELDLEKNKQQTKKKEGSGDESDSDGGGAMEFQAVNPMKVPMSRLSTLRGRSSGGQPGQGGRPSGGTAPPPPPPPPEEEDSSPSSEEEEEEEDEEGEEVVGNTPPAGMTAPPPPPLANVPPAGMVAPPPPPK
jgi:hypothetical protein